MIIKLFIEVDSDRLRQAQFTLLTVVSYHRRTSGTSSRLQHRSDVRFRQLQVGSRVSEGAIDGDRTTGGYGCEFHQSLSRFMPLIPWTGHAIASRRDLGSRLRNARWRKRLVCDQSIERLLSRNLRRYVAGFVRKG